MSAQQPFGRVANLIRRLDLVPALSQVSKTSECLLLTLLREILFTMKPIEGTKRFDTSCPPGHLSCIRAGGPGRMRNARQVTWWATCVKALSSFNRLHREE